MKNLRRQAIDAAQPFEYYLAADARHSRTDYCDDQAWTVRLGRRDEAAMAFQTQFGGRAGLVSLVPMWRIGDSLVYQAWSHARPPVITHFAPDFMQVEAALLEEVELLARFVALESRAAGGEFTLRNHSAAAITVQFELFGHVAINRRRRKLNVLTLADYSLALHLGEIGNLNPVVTLADASVEIYGGRINSPKLGRRLQIAPGGEVRLPFVVAGLPDMRDSFSIAMNWLARPWADAFEGIDRAAAAIPKISLGQPELNRLLDLSYAHLVKAFMRPTEQLPAASFVASRAGNRGWSRRGTGSDHIRAWSGQDPTLAYLALPAIASIDSALAQAAIRNYLATQDETGFVDRQPGLGGQRQGLLMMPLLARLTWLVYQQSGDRAFLAEALPGLLAFFQRWLAADMDADTDGLPEWRSERQLGYIALPTFGRATGRGQGADIRYFESPDLLAYLISEADALRKLADELGEAETAKTAAEDRARLAAWLEEFWQADRYAYRDRDSHITSAGLTLLQDGPGDQIHQIDRALPEPARLLIRIVGGLSQRPRINLTLKGKDKNGRPLTIKAGAEDFDWQNRQGIYTPETLLAYVESLAISGLSRVFKVYAATIDSSRLDINALLPLWTGDLPAERAAPLADLAMDEAHFLRPNGLTMVSAQDRHFDPSNARGGGGIWLYWLTLIGEGLVKAGYRAEATALLKRVLNSLTRVLQREGKLSQFYHADEIQGIGEAHHIGGLAPLHLLQEVLGVRITATDTVWVGGEFSWGEPVKIEQHGVTVKRSATAIEIEFTSGHQETLPAAAPWQKVQDPTPIAPVETAAPAPAPEFVLPSEAAAAGPVKIEIDGSKELTDAPPTAPNSVENAASSDDAAAEVSPS